MSSSVARSVRRDKADNEGGGKGNVLIGVIRGTGITTKSPSPTERRKRQPPRGDTGEGRDAEQTRVGICNIIYDSPERKKGGFCKETKVRKNQDLPYHSMDGMIKPTSIGEQKKAHGGLEGGIRYLIFPALKKGKGVP